MKKKKIYLNHRKSEALLFAKPSANPIKPAILVNSKQIDYVAKCKNLGIIFNENLSWNDHVSTLCGRIYFVLNSLQSLNAFAPLELRRKLVVALVVPIFSYGDVIFSATTAGNLHRLELCFNACLRYIYKRRKFAHLSDVRCSLLGCELHTFYQYRLALQIFAIMDRQQPKYLSDYLVPSRSSRLRNITYPRARTNFLGSSFFCERGDTLE